MQSIALKKERPTGNPTILSVCNQEWNDPSFLKTLGSFFRGIKLPGLVFWPQKKLLYLITARRKVISLQKKQSKLINYLIRL